jgi:PKD repeat protein
VGTYTVSLTVRNANGEDMESKTDYITAGSSPLTPPEAAFTATPLSGNVPLTVVFRDRSTGQPDSWVWDFGDGGHGYGRIGVHRYRLAGTYTVTLTVSNADGSDTETKVDLITVDRQRSGGYAGRGQSLSALSFPGLKARSLG